MSNEQTSKQASEAVPYASAGAENPAPATPPDEDAVKLLVVPATVYTCEL